MKITSRLAMLSLALASLPLHAQADKLTLTRTHGDLTTTIVVEPKSPNAGDPVRFHAHVTRRVIDPTTRKRIASAVTDATLVAHVGHGENVENTFLEPDTAEAGSYVGTVTFDHPGTEGLHVGVTVPDKKEWLIKVAIRVHAATKRPPPRNP